MKTSRGMSRQTHILFVCSGNTCRSPMAEGYFKSLLSKAGVENVRVSSAGTSAVSGTPASLNAVSVMKDLKIDISAHSSSPLDLSRLKESDLIVAMTSMHRSRIGAMLPEALPKTRLLLEFAGESDKDIGDPFGGNLAEYKKCFEQMRPALDNLFLEIIMKRKTR